ncbi:hypothetical protein TruAng_001535 [Truncatella angustata]|nr:hypothetical protein TruAng_001535 [Truncatella angustata]
MDQRRLSTSAAPNWSSALPRPTSRLPQPRASTIPALALTRAPAAAPTLRPAASTEGLRGRFAQSKPAAEPRSPITANTSRLRTPTSREQLRGSNPTTPSTLRTPGRTNLPPVASRRARDTSLSREPSRERAALDAQDGQFRKPLVPRRRPSGQFVSAFQAESAIDEEDAQDVLPPLASSTEDGLTLDALSIRLAARKARPSLAERTMETLSHLPSSPVAKRNTNFFDHDPSSRRPSSRASRATSVGSRPGSSYQSDGSNGKSLSRPGSSSEPLDASYTNFRASSSSYKPPLSTVQGTPSRRVSGIAKPPNFKPASAASRIPSNPPLSALASRTSSPEKKVEEAAPSKSGAKPSTARPLRSRASINGLVKKPSITALSQPDTKAHDLPARQSRKVSLASVRSAATTNTNVSTEDRNLSSASTASTALTFDSAEDAQNTTTARKSSAALRDQIAKAKAAKRTALRQVSGGVGVAPLKSPLIPTDNTFDFGLSDDPFNQAHFETSNRRVMQSRIDMGRTTGRLNIAAMGLKQIPDEVVKMYDLESVGHGASWAESMDLTRFVAADNELEMLDDSIFPDTDPMDFADDEDSRGHQFGGLEALDLHGNTLIAVPLGLRRLQQLTSLNLAQNKLANGCLEVISQVRSLRDLKLGGNLLYGKLDSSLSSLENLEILDLKGNEITALPDSFDKLTRLRVLNLNENALESLPFGTLAKLPLIELFAHKNRLAGTLLDVEVEVLPNLQTLDVSSNQLSLIALGPISMPSLLQVTISSNRLQSLPDISSWGNLHTLNAAENSITAIPDGFASLENLKSADFTSNDIRVVPPEIARMNALTLLRIVGNPLKDKKFTSMTTDELKDSLAARLEPLAEFQGGVEQFGNGFDPSGSRSLSTYESLNSLQAPLADNDDNEDSRSENDDFATPPTSAPQSPVRERSNPLGSQTWPIKPGGILDRANTKSSSLHPVVCSKLVVDQTIREVRLQHNVFTNFPNSLSFFADTLSSLNISHNQFVGEGYLCEELDLTALKELNLSYNHITSLAPLVTHLRAPNLQKLDISFNRIVSLPALRDAFPSLEVLLVSNNHLEDLDPDWVTGLKIVAAENNDIAHLNPRLGLQPFERLEVSGNRFRVPRWNVLERGTEATLRWLRGRVPVAEMAEWRAKSGNVDDDDGDFE